LTNVYPNNNKNNKNNNNNNKNKNNKVKSKPLELRSRVKISLRGTDEQKVAVSLHEFEVINSTLVTKEPHNVSCKKEERENI
jgi:hypothetical protein